MSQLQALRASSSLHHVATLLDFEPKYLAYVVYKIPDATKYHSFNIAKRGGGLRQISAPCDQLKLLQKKLSDLLQNCIDEINSSRKFQDQLAHGFKRDCSIITNAMRHQRRRYVFNIDLHNFFGTVNFGRVRGFFIKNANFMLHPKVATVLAQIACHEHTLPQGSPCSPVISNLIGHILDIRLCRLASKNGCTYSRYADDITFSTNKSNFPPSIARPVAGDDHKWEAGDRLQEIVARAGFSINPQKTRMQYHSSRQDVTGLVVNRKVNIRSEYRRTVRAMSQHLFLTGKFEFVQSIADVNGVLTPAKVEGSIEQLHGIFGHIDSVDCHNEKIESRLDSKSTAVRKAAQTALRSKQRLYRRFLIFKDFYSALRPVVVCEGKTDNIYLLYAIKALAVNYPRLATILPNNKVAINIRILKTLDSSIGRVLMLGHGASDLVRLIEQYLDEMHKFKAPGMKQPVILLADNDGGADEIYKMTHKLTKKKASKGDPYFHLSGNLYVVMTPLQRGTDKSAIEDCFEDNIKTLTLGGKTFSADSKPDSSIHFGKNILAQYVRQNASKINFSGFSGVLDRILAVLEDYDARLAKAGVSAGATVI